METVMLPTLVLKVASKTELAEMQVGGLAENQTTRFVEPVAGGQVGVTAAVVSGWVVGVGKVVPVGTVVVVTVVLVVAVVVVVVVGGVADLLELFTRNTMTTISAATMARPMPRRMFFRRLRLFSMTACFWSRAARCRALLSVGTERHATETAGQRACAPCRSGFSTLRQRLAPRGA